MLHGRVDLLNYPGFSLDTTMANLSREMERKRFSVKSDRSASAVSCKCDCEKERVKESGRFKENRLERLVC